MNWILFVFLAGVIIVAGSRLSLYADILAIKLNLSRSAIGVLLVSIVTTLPEMTTTLGAIYKVGSPDLALGNNFGSILFNLGIIGICDIVLRQGGILRHISRRELQPAFGSLVLIAIAAVGLIFTTPLSIFGLQFGLGSVIVVAVYICLFAIIQKSGALAVAEARDESAPEKKMSATVVGFAVCSVLIVISGISLAVVGDRIAVSTGLSRSFVGTLFLAISTSLPELTVGISSVRRGAYDLMFGNVMGANMLNVLVIALADLFYLKGALNVPLNLGWSQIFSAGGAMLATLLAIGGITGGSDKRQTGFIAWRSAAIIIVYCVCLAVIFKGWI